MKKFLAIYLGHETEVEMDKWDALDEDTRNKREQAGISAWMKWVEKNAASIIDTGSPLGVTKRANPKGISDTKNRMTAYTVVQAKSHEDAAELFKDHPHFTIFPGDSVEIMECLPLPEM